MKSIKLTELGNVEPAIRKKLVKTTKEQTFHIVECFKDVFNTSSISLTLTEASHYPEEAIQAIVSVNQYGKIYSFTTPETIISLLDLHLSCNNLTNETENPVTQTHIRLLQKLTLLVSKQLFGEGTELITEPTEEDITNIGMEIKIIIDNRPHFFYLFVNDVLMKNIRTSFSNEEPVSESTRIQMLGKIPTDVDCTLMKGTMPISDMLSITKGSFIPLTQQSNIDIKVNNKKIFNGELQLVNRQYGVKIHE
ncbi:FliM/FliN family flagellar motor switch protein [Vibrio sp. SS-MA-C1-2]|uniref:FliM/FliN family flagellar motor switch protein n=1 Tax=Vibrio sp. SS-MA-C1-2 TaxID=2908646 RepID=UPI001F4113E8|nr:FliM/FliN family flagellar motor switch protein [Vibrio sp. SS-MA-C1-2]UJF18016.1 FliM/FliN family flagellar motor switch protein [Vibrio sp. SS-MA-C1-2]